MSEVTSERFCLLCSQMVSREEKGVLVKKSFPEKPIILHEGCARRVYEAFLEWKKENEI